MRIRDFLLPGVEVTAGRVIGGGSFGRTPEALSPRILVELSLIQIIPGRRTLRTQ